MRGFSRNEEDQFVNEARLRVQSGRHCDQRLPNYAGTADQCSARDRKTVFILSPLWKEQNGELIIIVPLFDIIQKSTSEEITAKQILDSKKFEWIHAFAFENIRYWVPEEKIL